MWRASRRRLANHGPEGNATLAVLPSRTASGRTEAAPDRRARLADRCRPLVQYVLKHVGQLKVGTPQCCLPSLTAACRTAAVGACWGRLRRHQGRRHKPVHVRQALRQPAARWQCQLGWAVIAHHHRPAEGLQLRQGAERGWQTAGPKRAQSHRTRRVRCGNCRSADSRPRSRSCPKHGVKFKHSVRRAHQSETHAGKEGQLVKPKNCSWLRPSNQADAHGAAMSMKVMHKVRRPVRPASCSMPGQSLTLSRQQVGRKSGQHAEAASREHLSDPIPPQCT
jgi:hypothetical protein